MSLARAPGTAREVRLDRTLTLRVDGRPAQLTAAGTALRLEFSDPAAARRSGETRCDRSVPPRV